MSRAIPKSEIQSRVKGRGVASNLKTRFDAYETISAPVGDEDAPVIRTEVRHETPRKIITRNTSPDIPFDRSINPYRGCEHGCVYCFARPSHAYWDMSPGLDFETRLIAKPNAAELLARELSKKTYKVAPMAFGTNTDAYQPIERDYEIMRGCLQVLSDFNHPVTITTKGSLIERDIDILSDMAARNLVVVAVSVTTLDARLSRSMEPRVPAPKRRLQVIRALSDRGIPVRAMIAPIIPGLSDHELENIMQAVCDAGGQGANWAMLRLPYEVRDMFRDWLYTAYPNHASKVMARLREMHGGREYDASFGKRFRGDGEFVKLLSLRYKVAAQRLGFDRPFPRLDCSQFRVPPRAGDQLSLF